MPSSKFTDDLPVAAQSHVVREEQIEYGFIGKLQGLKYEYRSDIRDRAALEKNFREKFEALNCVKLSEGEFARLLDEVVTPDVFTAARMLRERNAFTPEAVQSLKGDEARAAFIQNFKEVQRLKTQLDQYTDLTADNTVAIEHILPAEQLQGFRGAYLETAQRLKQQLAQPDQGSTGAGAEVDQLDFEFVLFASAVIDYDYIMGLMSRYSQQGPGKQKMSREQFIGLIQADANFMNERDDIAAYINTLKAGEGLSETAIREGYTRFKKEKDSAELSAIATRHQLAPAALQTFVDGILQRMIFDGGALSDLMAPLGLGWKARAQAETALMKELLPLLQKRAEQHGGREISGLSAYEQ